jgi:hypothetical protein
MNEKGDLRELYQSGVARTPENDPERGDYVPSEAWLSYRLVSAVWKTQLELPIRAFAESVLFSKPTR